MIVTQVSVEIILPPTYKGMEGTRATITYKPNEPGATRVYLPTSELNLEQLKLLGDFVNKLSLFGDRAKAIIDDIICAEKH